MAERIENEDDSLEEELGGAKPPVPAKANGAAAADADDKKVDQDEPEVGVEELRRQLAESEERRIAAEARASASNGRASGAEENERAQYVARVETYGREVDTNLKLANTNIANTKKELSAAQAEGNFDLVADLQEKLADFTANRRWLTSEKNGVEQAVKNPPKTINERFKEFVEKDMHPAARAWTEAHPAMFTDQDLRERVTAADNYLVAKHGPGFRNTPAYFRGVEEMIGEAQSADVGGDPPAPRNTRTAISSRPKDVTKPKPKPATAMAPNREVSSGQTIEGVVAFTADGMPILSPEQQRAANNLGMSFVDYANNLKIAAEANHPSLQGRRH